MVSKCLVSVPQRTVNVHRGFRGILSNILIVRMAHQIVFVCLTVSQAVSKSFSETLSEKALGHPHCLNVS